MVVLPAPLCPTRAVDSLGPRRKDTSFKTGVSLPG